MEGREEEGKEEEGKGKVEGKGRNVVQS